MRKTFLFKKFIEANLKFSHSCKAKAELMLNGSIFKDLSTSPILYRSLTNQKNMILICHKSLILKAMPFWFLTLSVPSRVRKFIQ